MTELRNPSANLRRKAYKIKTTARYISVFLTAFFMLAVWYFAGLVGLILMTIGLVILSISPLGSYVSVFTLWANGWVNSCPNCLAVSFDTLDTKYLKCDSCGKETVEISPLYSDGWIYRHGDAESVEHYCSWDCRNQSVGGEKQ